MHSMPIRRQWRSIPATIVSNAYRNSAIHYREIWNNINKNLCSSHVEAALATIDHRAYGEGQSIVVADWDGTRCACVPVQRHNHCATGQTDLKRTSTLIISSTLIYALMFNHLVLAASINRKQSKLPVIALAIVPLVSLEPVDAPLLPPSITLYTLQRLLKDQYRLLLLLLMVVLHESSSIQECHHFAAALAERLAQVHNQPAHHHLSPLSPCTFISVLISDWLSPLGLLEVQQYILLVLARNLEENWATRIPISFFLKHQTHSLLFSRLRIVKCHLRC